MGEALGVVLTIGMGVITIAGIYQLNKKGSPIVPATQAIVTTTLTSIFK